MLNLKNKTMAILIATILTISMATSMMLLPNASAHTPAWQIPTYAFIVAAPSPIGVGQTAHIYMWLDCVFGAAGGTIAATGTNASTVSSALLGNNYRFHNYNLTITAPDGTKTTQIFDTIADSTSSQYTKITPTQVGTYIFNFTFPGQDYAQYQHYEKSSLINDTYLPSSASTTLNVQQDPIPDAINSYPLPEQYWTHPIYGENTDWWAISSNWLGTGSPVASATGSGYISGLSNGNQIQRYPGDAVGPLTSHIMWTKSLEMGGVVGGNPFVAGGSNPNGAVQGAAYFEGSSYQNRYTNPIIINGYLYYTEPLAFTGPTSGPTDCVDLRTGQIIWSRSDVPALSFGYIFNLWDPDQHGAFPPILFTSNFAQAFNAYTGTPMFNVTNVPTGTPAAGPNGEQLRYVFVNVNAGTNLAPSWYLQQWNSSKLWQYDINPYTGGGSLSPSIINATNGVLISIIPIPVTGTTGTLPTGANTAVPYGSVLTVNANIPINSSTIGGTLSGHGTTTYDWNVSIPSLNTMTTAPAVIAAFTNNMMLCRNGSLPTGFAAANTGTQQGPYTYFAVNLNASRVGYNVGDILWMKTYNPPAGNLTVVQGVIDPTADNGNGVFTESYGETTQVVGYSLATGQRIWGPTAPRASFDYYGNPGTPDADYQAAYGNLYASAFAGILYCWNLTTGTLEWTYGNGGAGNSTYAGLNVFYGDYPTFVNAVSNGVIYLAATEHTITDPIYKGAQVRAVNATTGQEIWTLSSYVGEFTLVSFAIADGFATFYNGYDNQIYSVGRGPSTTTIQAPLTQITAGNKVVIQGTVMDISTGTKQNQQATDFPNGVPASSDVSMKDWMGYVYQQKPLPTNFTGVPVSIVAIDPNGNYITLGNATTDTNGLFHYTWTTPNVPGDYSVYATFAGTNGYWPSNAVTAMTVQEGPQATAVPTSAPASMADAYFIPLSIGMIVVIVILAALVVLSMIRKRP
jgi:hypothetical protein